MTTELQTDVRGGCSVQRLVGRHCVATLIHGDSETMELPAADALVSDPPYGIGYAHGGSSGVQDASLKRSPLWVSLWSAQYWNRISEWPQ